MLDEQPKRCRQPAHLGILERREGLRQQVRVARRGGQAVERRGWELIERGLARGEHESRDAIGAARKGDLRVGATRVVGHERDGIQAKLVEGICEQRAAALGAQVGVDGQRDAVGAERQVERNAAMPIREPVDDLAPEIGVGQPAVCEDEWRALAAAEGLDGPLRQPQAQRLAQQRRAVVVRGTHAAMPSRAPLE